MKLFDAIYFVSCNFYKKREANSFKTSGLILMSSAGMCNLLLIAMALGEYTSFDFNATYDYRYVIVPAMMIIFFALSYFRFFRVTNYGEIEMRMEDFSPSSRTIYSLIGAVYLIGSFVSAIAFAAIHGGKN